MPMISLLQDLSGDRGARAFQRAPRCGLDPINVVQIDAVVYGIGVDDGV